MSKISKSTEIQIAVFYGLEKTLFSQGAPFHPLFRPNGGRKGPSKPHWTRCGTSFPLQFETFWTSEKFCRRLVELLTLHWGWDGENASPPKPEVLARMVGIILLLKRDAAVFVEPFLTPTIGGYAQLEWHDDSRTLDIEATAEGWAIVGSEIRAGGSESTTRLMQPLAKLTN